MGALKITDDILLQSKTENDFPIIVIWNKGEIVVKLIKNGLHHVEICFGAGIDDNLLSQGNWGGLIGEFTQRFDEFYDKLSKISPTL